MQVNVFITIVTPAIEVIIVLNFVFVLHVVGTHPLPSEGLGEAFSIYTYLSVKQIVTMTFAELITPVPRKTIVFRIKVLTFANRKKQPHQQLHPTSPRGRNADSEIAPRSLEVSVLKS